MWSIFVVVGVVSEVDGLFSEVIHLGDEWIILDMGRSHLRIRSSWRCLVDGSNLGV